MRTIFLFFFALLISQTLSAQTSSFVEVVVEDTIQLEAEEIIYDIVRVESLAVDSITTDTTGTIVRPAHPTGDLLLEIRKLIRTMRLDTLNEANYTLSNNSYYRSLDKIRVRLRSAAQLKEFISYIRNIDGILGTISVLRSSKEKALDQVLLQRLFSQAKMKAEALARIAGKKLGSVLSIKEQRPEGGWTMYPPLSHIPGWHTEVSGHENEFITLRRSMIVQFNWQ